MHSRAGSGRRFRQYRIERRSRRPDQQVAPDGPQPEPGARPRSHRPAFSLASRFIGLLDPRQRLTMVLALCTLTVSTLLGLAMPYSTKIAIDFILLDTPGPEGLPESLGLPTDRMSLLWILSGAMVAITIVSVSVGMWGRWQTTRLTKRVQISVRRRVFAHAVRLPLHRAQALKSGGVASILREDAGGVGELLFSMVYNPWRAIVQVSLTMVILALTDWRLVIGSLVLLPTIWMTHRAWINRLRPMWRDIRLSRQRIDGHSTEVFAGLRVVRGFGRETGEASRFVGGNAFMMRQEILAWWWSRGLEIVWQLLVPIASSAILLYGGWQVIEGNLTIGDLMMFTAYLLMLLGPIEALVVSATNIQNQLAGLDRVLDLISEPLEHESVAPGATRLDRDRVAGEVTLDSVSFVYPGSEKPVLEEIDAVVPAGSIVALVGASGAGKTTLCNLVARFYLPTKGRVLLDGIDTRDIRPDDYRSILGIVEQDVFLFDGTIRDNIAYARRDATEREIIEAAQTANAHTFITDTPDGYDTLIGERGVRLSGGQRQRIAIARAILADPRILILDEATSNLDSESERLIQSAMRELMKGRTTFIIAHRLSTIRDADLVLVLEAGRIAERGGYEELAEAGGRFSELLRIQQTGAADAPIR
ncbi:MAG: ABC transporter ATP-binding protein [Phycisphaerales bacterium]|nr:MAG: ABC transporter ATP-binding protein [Phycisphaerales bacterium]